VFFAEFLATAGVFDRWASSPRTCRTLPGRRAWPRTGRRNGFIEVRRGVQRSSDPIRMLAQVRDPLLAVLRISPDFRRAYDPPLRRDPKRSRPCASSAARIELFAEAAAQQEPQSPRGADCDEQGQRSIVRFDIGCLRWFADLRIDVCSGGHRRERAVANGGTVAKTELADLMNIADPNDVDATARP